MKHVQHRMKQGLRTLGIAAAGALLLLNGSGPLAAATLLESSLSRLAAREEPGREEPFTFAVLSDTHVGQGLPADGTASISLQVPPTFARVVGEVNALRPDLVFATGDLVQGGTDSEMLVNAEWDAFAATATSCGAPVFPVSGNHDIYDAMSRGVWKERIGPAYYSFSYRASHFIVLDTQESAGTPRIGEQQMAWLEADLEANRGARSIFVFTHRPLFDAEAFPDANWEAVHELLARSPVKGVFAGHYHRCSRYQVRDGITYTVVSASGGGVNGNDEVGEFSCYLLVRVRGSEISYAVIRPGSIEPPDVVTETLRREYAELQSKIKVEDGATALVGLPLKATVKVAVTNPLREPFKTTIHWHGNGSGVSVSPQVSEQVLPPSSTVIIPLSIAGPLAAPGPGAAWPQLTVTLPYPSGDRTAEIALELPKLLGAAQAPRAAAPPMIDGDLSDWDEVPALAMLSDAPEPADLTPSLRFMQDETYLYVAAEVEDDVHHAPITAEKHGGEDALWISGWGMWCRVVRSNDGRVLVQNCSHQPAEDLTERVPAAVVREDGVTRYEVAWPRSLMPAGSLAPGTSFAVDISCSDRDDAASDWRCPKRCLHQTYQVQALP